MLLKDLEPTESIPTSTAEEYTTAEYIKYSCNITTEPSLIRNNPARQERCCYKLKRWFHFFWYVSGVNLGDYLRAIRDWGCDYFEDECETRTFAFVEYPELVYDRYCNETKFMAKCKNTLLDILSSKNIELPEAEGSGMLDEIENQTLIQGSIFRALQSMTNLTLAEQLQTCVQVRPYIS